MKTVNQKIDEGRQFRMFEMREIRTSGEESYIVEGYAATFDQPYELYAWDGYVMLEKIDAAAFDEADMSDVIMQYDHTGRVFARVANKTLTLSTDAHGLKIRADLGGTENGRALFNEIAGGYITKMSIGFTVSEDTHEERKDHDTGVVTITRTITGIRKLYDVSAVSLPANNATEISARSYCEGVIEQLTEECRKREKTERRKKKIKIMLNMQGGQDNEI